ncbi:MAG: FtsW/RodA/SpoVE family cell cycle protein [Bacteroidales bacterium]|nr:MAG: FtsW/RodA/SpoVE family cell cycle protein [Bacteroidales bacterium]
MRERFGKYLKGDRVVWAVIIVLSLYSILAVYSSTSTLAYTRMGGNTTYYLLRHAVILSIGIVIIFITHLVPYKYYSRLSQLFLFMAIPLLLLTLLLGTSLNQASRWLTLPGLGFTIQTSDFAKMALIMYIARILSLKQHNIRSYKEAFVPIMMPVIMICVLILPANLSTALIVFATSVILMFIGRMRMKHLLSFAGIAILVVTIFITGAILIDKKGRIGTWQNRIESYINGDMEENYQVEQAKIAIATGGLFGKRPGKSTQRNFLPHPYSDFIYAIIIEEYGLLLGALPLLLAYLFLLFRAGVIVRKCRRTFPAFLAIGLAISIVFQAMVNMAVAVNLIPVTGQTLPFVSMGGSSLLFTSISFGIILSVSRGVDKTEMDEETEPAAK